MQLNVAQAFTLVATRDVAGRPLGPQGLVTYGVAGAVLVDLGLADRITIDPDRGDRIRVLSVEPVGDPVGDDVLRRLAGTPSTVPVSAWIRLLGSARLRDDVLGHLVDLSLLVRDASRTLGVAPVMPDAWSLAAPAQVADSVRRALRGGHLDAVTACVVVLCDGCGVLYKIAEDLPPDAVARVLAHVDSPPLVGTVADVIRRLRASRGLTDGKSWRPGSLDARTRHHGA